MLWVLIRIASEAILISTHNIGFYEELTKIIFELSSNMHLIPSAAYWHSRILTVPSSKELSLFEPRHEKNCCLTEVSHLRHLAYKNLFCEFVYRIDISVPMVTAWHH